MARFKTSLRRDLLCRSGTIPLIDRIPSLPNPLSPIRDFFSKDDGQYDDASDFLNKKKEE